MPPHKQSFISNLQCFASITPDDMCVEWNSDDGLWFCYVSGLPPNACVKGETHICSSSAIIISAFDFCGEAMTTVPTRGQLCLPFTLPHYRPSSPTMETELQLLETDRNGQAVTNSPMLAWSILSPRQRWKTVVLISNRGVYCTWLCEERGLGKTWTWGQFGGSFYGLLYATMSLDAWRLSHLWNASA